MRPSVLPQSRRAKFAVTASLVVLVASSAGYIAYSAVSGSNRPAPVITPNRARTRPNIILIVTDDQRWNTLWAMPNVRRDLVAHGVTFTNSFVTTSLCCPSRASILTGQYSRHTGVYNDAGRHGGAPAFTDTSTLATWLHGAGYQTALVGKYLNDYNLMPHHEPPGWSEWDAIASPSPAIRSYDYKLNENGHIVRYGSAPGDYADTVLGKIALRFVTTAQSPFFLEFCPIAPHTPAIPAPRDLERFRNFPLPDRPSFNEADVSDKPWSGMPQFPSLTDTSRMQGYWDHALASLQQVDRSIGEFVNALRDDGQLGNTVSLFTSDNGLLLGEHRMRVVKIWPYEESIRVPLVVAGADVTDPGRRNADFALNIDLAPTVAQLAGVRPRLPQDGRSLVPLLEDQHPRWRRSFVVEYLGPGGARSLYVAPFEGIRTVRYLYVQYGQRHLSLGGPPAPYPNGSRELYDLRTDPYELNNLAALPQYQALRRSVAAQLRHLLHS
jgi:N-acetylglucosamine-6-sulfatase